MNGFIWSSYYLYPYTGMSHLFTPAGYNTATATLVVWLVRKTFPWMLYVKILLLVFLSVPAKKPWPIHQSFLFP